MVLPDQLPPSGTVAAPPAPRPRRCRIAAWTGAGVLALVAAAVGLDRGAEAFIERTVANRMQDCLGTPDKPQVEIAGFPLLPDLVRGRLDRMDITARDASAQGVRVEELTVQARGATRKGGSGEIDSLTGSGLVSYDAMSAQAPGVTLSYGGDGQIQVAAGLGLLGGSASATPSIVNGALVLQPEQISTSLFGEFDLGELPPIRFELRELPQGLDVNLTPTERGLEFAFDGTDVRLPDDPCAGT